MLGRLSAKTKCFIWRAYATCCAAISYLNIRRLAMNGIGHLHVIALVEHMGDIVACLPVAVELKRQNPDARIIWVAHQAYADLLIGNPNLSKVITQVCLGQWILLKRALANTDVTIVDLHLHGKPCAKTRLAIRKSEQLRSVNTENYYHYGSLLRSFTLGAGFPYPTNPQPNLFYAIEQWIGRIAIPSRPYIVLHTQSNEASRNWTPRNFSLLTAELIKAGFDVAEIGHTSIIEYESPHFYRRSGNRSPSSYTLLIAKASLFIGIDSGFAHVANALGVKGVVILGSYRAFTSYNPYSGAYENIAVCRIVRVEGAAASEVNVNAVLNAALNTLQYSKGSEIRTPAHPHSRSIN